MKAMGTVHAFGSARGLGRVVRRRSSFAVIFVFSALLFQLACESLTPLDTKPLDDAGMRYWQGFSRLSCVGLNTPKT